MFKQIKVILVLAICLFSTLFILTSAQAQTVATPTVIEPAQGAIVSQVKPIIAGLTISNTLVRIYIDGIYNGKTEILQHDSGTASFTYQSFLNLVKGEHIVWLIAENEAGQKSRPSNPIKFTIKQPAISEAAQESEVGKVVEIKPAEPSQAEEPEVIISPIEGTVEDQEIQDIINQEVTTETAQTGLIDEGEEKQSKLNLNLIIFIIFLIGIITWIFWVNRELIKERRAQAKKDIAVPTSTAPDFKKEKDKDKPTSSSQEQPPLV